MYDLFIMKWGFEVIPAPELSSRSFPTTNANNVDSRQKKVTIRNLLNYRAYVYDDQQAQDIPGGEIGTGKRKTCQPRGVFNPAVVLANERDFQNTKRLLIIFHFCSFWAPTYTKKSLQQ